MKNNIQKIILLSIIVLFYVSAYSDDKGVISKIQEQYKNLLNFQVKFEQENIMASVKERIIKGEGTLFYKKPSKLRWNYDTPEKQEIITDGKNLWLYKPEEKQVTTSTLAENVQSKDVIAILTGEVDLKNIFNIKLKEKVDEIKILCKDCYILELIPKDTNMGVTKIILAILKSDYMVSESFLFDPIGNITHMIYKEYKINNNNFEDEMFIFKPSLDTEIIKLP